MDKLIDDLIKLAFAEDIGDGDHTTLCCIPETAMGKSQLIILSLIHISEPTRRV